MYSRQSLVNMEDGETMDIKVLGNKNHERSQSLFNQINHGNVLEHQQKKNYVIFNYRSQVKTKRKHKKNQLSRGSDRLNQNINKCIYELQNENIDQTNES